MTGKTHVICSTAAIASFAAFNAHGVTVLGTEISPLVSIVPAAVGALLPDIDIPQSKLGSKFKILSKNMKHRGITHTLLVPAVLTVGMVSVETRLASILSAILVGLLVGIIYGWKKGAVVLVGLTALTWSVPQVGASILFGLSAGWLLHIFEDLFNKKGCPIFWPITDKRVHIASFKTRHWSEYVFLGIWLGGCMLWVLWNLVGPSLMGWLRTLIP